MSYRFFFCKTFVLLPLCPSTSASPPHLCSLASPPNLSLVISSCLQSLHFEETPKSIFPILSSFMSLEAPLARMHLVMYALL
ncbi:hypothetical protein ES319_D08G096500v1 [Gossypium barbadense]|uniref:Secreted protein n=2 Tax=Gossypium TaxID=3633 RepID=A0A5J5QC51_GOSBA|nr:hypothetical protein ES319_D08G096500v1 [Gossypium barbadense]TYG56924.1 hypothetical protein ES288_D08G102300v1 [Gossypium darwinii]